MPARLSRACNGKPVQADVLTPAPPERFPAHSKVMVRCSEAVSKISEYDNLIGLVTMPTTSRVHFSSLIVGVVKWLRMKKSLFGVTFEAMVGVTATLAPVKFTASRASGAA